MTNLACTRTTQKCLKCVILTILDGKSLIQAKNKRIPEDRLDTQVGIMSHKTFILMKLLQNVALMCDWKLSVKTDY